MWLDSVELDFPDIRVALDLLTTIPDRVDDGLRLFGSLRRYWFLRAQPSEALSLAESLLSRAPAGGGLSRATALLGGMWAAVYQNPLQARRWGEEGLRIAGSLEREDLVCEISAMLAAVSFFTEQSDLASGKRALRVARRLADPALLAFSRMGLGLAHLAAGNTTAARRELEEALVAGRTSGDLVVQYIAASDLVELARMAGNAEDGERYFRVAQGVCEHLRYPDPLLSAGYGILLLESGRQSEARDVLLSAFASARGLSSQQGLYTVFALAAYAVEVGDHETAARLLGFGHYSAGEAGLAFRDLDDIRRKTWQRAERSLTAARFANLYNSGASLDLAGVAGLIDNLR
jgi:hypothetical protein